MVGQGKSYHGGSENWPLSAQEVGTELAPSVPGCCTDSRQFTVIVLSQTVKYSDLVFKQAGKCMVRVTTATQYDHLKKCFRQVLVP